MLPSSSFVMKLPCELLSHEKTPQSYSQMLESLSHSPLSEKQSCNFQDEGVIRVGSGYQANIPEITFDSDEFAHDDQKLWDPRRLSEEMVNEYLKLLSIRNATEEEKALWILHTCNYDVQEALKRQRFAPQMMIGFDSDWSEEERSCFERAVRRYGKVFHSIQKMLRTKSVVEIVEYYYYWKHQRMQNAQMNGNSQ